MNEVFRASRTLPASAERVWELLTVPEQFSVWFGTDQVVVPLDQLEMDVRPGGLMRATMQLPGGGEIFWRGAYAEVREPEFLSMGLTDQPDDELGVPITFSLEPVGGGTLLTIVQDRGDFSDEQVERTIAGYGSFLDTMESMLRKG